MRAGLLSGQVFFPFGALWLAGSHGGGGITSGMMAPADPVRRNMAWAFGIGGGGVA